jgi:rSAM/selenodomain-associated transferase 2
MISIIIPVYNEAEEVISNLKQIQNRISSFGYVTEILVVDGGSNDGTLALINQVDGIKCFESPRGRSRQMNYGAKQATAEILYFLHIDSFPPQDFDRLIIESVQNRHQAGCFKMKFRSRHLWLQFISWFTKFNTRSCRGGDQSLFVTKSLFEKVGGYNEEFLIYEDHEILKLIYGSSDFKVIQHSISTSARRFEHKGILKLQVLFWIIYFKKWSGASSHELYSFYMKHINN